MRIEMVQMLRLGDNHKLLWLLEEGPFTRSSPRAEEFMSVTFQVMFPVCIF